MKLNEKFLESFVVSDYEVLTETGYEDILSTNKTIPYKVYRIELEDNYFLECADDHIIIDSNGNEIFAKDSLGKYLITITGYKKVLSVVDLNYEDNMYDLSINSDNQTYFSNGVLSHNTTTATIILLHYALFNDAKRIAILANKESASIEVLERIQMAYENLPLWMQRGVVEWNKKSVTFENLSKIIAATTSSSSIRGKACIAGEYKLKIRHKESLFEEEISFIDLKNRLGEIENNIVRNDLYEIYSPEGFVNFDGLFISNRKCYYIELENGYSLKATAEHSILCETGFKQLLELLVGDIILLENCDSKISKIIKLEDFYEVFDPINCGSIHSYYCESFTNENCSYIYIDECAFVDNWSEFYASTYPTISSGKTTKMLFTSTPNSLNHFYEFWKNATEGFVNSKGEVETNGFVPILATYDKVPGRDEKWKEETLAALNYDYSKFDQEYNGAFLGSSTTLLSGQTLKTLAKVPKNPIQRNEYIKQYEQPIRNIEKPELNHIYVMICDVSKGKGMDYSTFSVFDITNIPYIQVCTYRCNTVTPTDFATTIVQMGKFYNEAYVLVEINVGDTVPRIIKYDYDYENLLCMESAGRAGKRISSGFGQGIEMGIYTTSASKRLGCSMTKLLLEQNKIILYDNITVNEFSTFAKDNKQSYSAQQGFHDDMVMTVVIFAYITQDPYFVGLTDKNVMSMIRDKTEQEIFEELMPFGLITSALDNLDQPEYVKFEGEKGLWVEADDDGFKW